MTLPNKLTFLRILIIPVMVIIYCIPYLRNNAIFLNMSYANFINLILFMIASFTDFLDGHIARKYNLITTFGKFADPLADKMLVFTAMSMFMATGYVLPVWVFVIILIREFMVSGIRMVAVENGKVIAASKLGKIKTFTTMIALIIMFWYQTSDVVLLIGQIGMYVACLFTVISGIDYFWKNREIILESI